MLKVLITCSHNSRPIAVNITNFLKGNLGLDIEVGPDLSRGIGSGEYVSKALLGPVLN